MIGRVPATAVSVCLYRISGEQLIACETVTFDNAAEGIDTVLRRAAISGKVEIGGKILNHFADLLNVAGDIIETVVLDSKSYKALKTRWMRCKVESGY